MHCIGEKYIKATNRIGYIKFNSKEKEKYVLKLSSLVFIDFQEKMPFQRQNLS